MKRALMQNGRRETMSYLRDWRQALRAPHVYRVANSTFRVHNQYLALTFLLLTAPVVFFGFPLLRELVHGSTASRGLLPQCQYYKYNKTYPVSVPIRTSKGISYRIAIVSDLDTDSRSPDKKNTWHSIMKTGSLFWNPNTNFLSVVWDDRSLTLYSSLAMKGRGMELSELVTFDGRLLSFDDRTGMVYFIEGSEVYPWVVLMDGNGRNSKGRVYRHVIAKSSLEHFVMTLHWLFDRL